MLHSTAFTGAHSVSQNAMDFSVFLKDQDPQIDPANHRGTRTVVKMVLAVGLGVPVGQNAIRLTTGGSWKEVKTAARLGMRAVTPLFKAEYRHHIEPRLIRCTITNSPWERYLHGFDGRA